VPFVSSNTECSWEIAFHGSHEIVPFKGWNNFLSFVVFFKVAVPEMSAPERCLRELLFNDRFTPSFTITILLIQSERIIWVDEITRFRPPLLLPIFIGEVELKTFFEGAVFGFMKILLANFRHVRLEI